MITIRELINSPIARSLGYKNDPKTEAEWINLCELLTILNTVRAQYGKPIYINSGYRSPNLNKAVGGVADSYHLKGQAVDIRLSEKDHTLANLTTIIELFRDCCKKLGYGSVALLEKPDKDGTPKWLHLEFRRFYQKHHVKQIK